MLFAKSEDSFSPAEHPGNIAVAIILQSDWMKSLQTPFKIITSSGLKPIQYNSEAGGALSVSITKCTLDNVLHSVAVIALPGIRGIKNPGENRT